MVGSSPRWTPLLDRGPGGLPFSARDDTRTVPKVARVAILAHHASLETPNNISQGGRSGGSDARSPRSEECPNSRARSEPQRPNRIRFRRGMPPPTRSPTRRSRGAGPPWELARSTSGATRRLAREIDASALSQFSFGGRRVRRKLRAHALPDVGLAGGGRGDHRPRPSCLDWIDVLSRSRSASWSSAPPSFSL